MLCYGKYERITGTPSDADEKNYNVPHDIVSFKDSIFRASDCTLRCLYWYNYSTPSSALIKNEGDNLRVMYDGKGDVTFNAATFTPKYIRFFKPSIHRYDGQNVDAGEIVIEHEQLNATVTGLLVCIPLSTTGNPSEASTILERLISDAPNNGDKDTFSNASFTLNKVIPQAPYYTYDGPLPYFECQDNKIYHYVVFHPANNGAVTINATANASLDAKVMPSNIVANPSKLNFFNSKGTAGNGFNGEDQIYIQCKPTDIGDGETKVYKDPISPLAGANVTSKETIEYIVYIIVGVVCIYVAYMLFKFITAFLSSDAVTKTKFTVQVGGLK